MATPTNLSDERRRRRSNDPLIAMRFQLEQVMNDFGLKACVLASDEGLLLVSPDAVDADDAEMLAAMGTMERREDGSFINQSLVDACIEGLTIADGDHGVFAQEFWAWDQPWTLVALGTLSRAQELSVMRAIMGIRRIARQNGPFRASA